MYVIKDEEAVAAVAGGAYCFLFLGNELLVKDTGEPFVFPMGLDAPVRNIVPEELYYIADLAGRPVYAGRLDERVIPGGASLAELRLCYGKLSEEQFWLACRGLHILHWVRTARYCGCCGAATAMMSEERALRCSSCGQVIYPRISPAVIVAVVRGRELLLVHSRSFAAGLYSVVAGFVDPAERLEDCVQRELMEEVGIQAKNLTYFGSQPWPFPDSLMIAFTAEYAGGELTVDQDEIEYGGWFTAERLPEIPGYVSIARHMIDWFVENH